MRKAGIEKPYEKLKELTRGQAISREVIDTFVDGLDLPDEDKARLKAMSPATYTGIASTLADQS